VSGTTDPALYGRARVGMTAYRVAVPAGTYHLRLLFAEVQGQGKGRRVFDVSVEGTTVASRLDIAAKVGVATAYDVERDVTVTDGELTVTFRRRKGYPTISGIEAVALDAPTTTTTAAPTTTTTAAPTTTTTQAPTTTTTAAPTTTTTQAPTTTTTAAPTGRTFFVDSVAGSDSNAGTSSSAPWRSIAKVNATSFSPGDVISFKRGSTWSEQLLVDSSGTSGSPVTSSTPVWSSSGPATS
jgi:hypothetical protein